MTNAAFKLEDAGFTRPQVDALSEFMDGSVATKADISDLRGDMKADISELRGELKADISDLRGEMKAGMERLDGRITSVAAELRTDIEKTRIEIEKTRTEIAPLKWMLVATSAGVLSIVVKSFFL